MRVIERNRFQQALYPHADAGLLQDLADHTLLGRLTLEDLAAREFEQTAQGLMNRATAHENATIQVNNAYSHMLHSTKLPTLEPFRKNREATMTQYSTRQGPPRKSGSVLVLVTVCLVLFLSLAALAADLGVAGLGVTQCQRTADAAALAAASSLIPESPTTTPDDRQDLARAEAATYAALNPVLHNPIVLDANWSNDPAGDVVLGRVNPRDPRGTFVATTTNVNAVKVRVRRDGTLNPPLPAFFSRVIGINGIPTQRYAIAMIIDQVRGFRSPGDETLNLLPFAVKKEDWEALLAGVGTDNYAYDPNTGTVSVGSDGVLELRLYPQTEPNGKGRANKGCCGSGGIVPGNFGTVDIGSPNNSTADLKRQILEGISSDDLAWHGGRLELGPDGTLLLNGDTGISASIQSELLEITGQPRVIMLYSKVSGNGNNATFTIVGFVGVRVMDANLTGSLSDKEVIVQPAPVVSTHAIASDQEGTSHGVYSTVRLVE